MLFRFVLFVRHFLVFLLDLSNRLYKMADVEYQYTTTTEKKVRKTKKSTSTSNKRRESNDRGEVTITEIDNKENQYPAIENGYDKGYFPLSILGIVFNCNNYLIINFVL